MKKFRKPYLSIFLALTIIFVSCSEQESFIEQKPNASTFKTVNNSNYRDSNDFFMDLIVDEDNSKIVKGELSMFDDVINVEMDITNGIEISSPINISDNEIHFYSNGELLKFKVINSTNNTTTIRFDSPQIVKDIQVDGKIDFKDFSSYYSTTSPSLNKAACPSCVVVGLIIVVGGAYCAYKQQTASSTCAAAYTACVQTHGSCSFQFESSSCGGTCNVNPH